MGGRGASSGRTGNGQQLFNRLVAGETLHVRNPSNGADFSVERTHRNGIAIINILQNGKPVHGRSGLLMSRAEAAEWLNNLQERK